MKKEPYFHPKTGAPNLGIPDFPEPAKNRRLFPVALPIAIMLFALPIFLHSQSESERVQAERNDIIYLNLMWHQHQPLYYKDPATGVYTRPWVRVHGTKDYLDMAEMLEAYPGVKVTFNLTPVLLRQLNDFIGGAKDLYQVLAEKPAASLTEDDRRFILTRFFDANWNNMVGRFPRYKELLEKRGDGSPESVERALSSFSVQDYRDLQIWFNLAWVDPAYYASGRLAELVRKGRGFSEADKTVLFSETLGILKRIVPEHRKLQDGGRIEVTTTPYAHPILPLVYTTNLAAKGDPGAKLPEWFSYPNDAIAHLGKSVEIYRELFGREPRGLWPGEGSVGQDIVRIVANAGYSWMASGEHVLAKSLGMDGFIRDGSERVVEADALYRPYYAVDRDGRKVAVLFRDVRLSDLIGFEYSGTAPEAAARDFMDRLERVRAKLAADGKPGPHLVSVILDGENAWENYPGDGKAFLDALYKALSASRTVKTVTPSEYLSAYPEQKTLQNLFWGSWFSPDYGTWIGEEEENLGWNYLGRTRKMLAEYDISKRKKTSPENLARALDSMYLAEGSDWFWWYGSDQDSGNDAYFDEAFRALLKEVYVALGEPVPDYLGVPIIPEKPVAPTASPSAELRPVADGRADAGEWDGAGSYAASGGSMANASDVLSRILYGFSPGALNLLLEARSDWKSAGTGRSATLYFSLPSAEGSSGTGLGGEILGFRASRALRIDVGSGATSAYAVSRYGEWEADGTTVTAAVLGRTAEIALPLGFLGDLQTGDRLNVKFVLSGDGGAVSMQPSLGPLLVSVPQLFSGRTLLAADDPSGDDNGPGTYVYPTDKVFVPGVFDVTKFTVADAGKNLLFTFHLRGPIENVWGSGVGLSVQTFDVYIDTDPGAGTGSRKLLEGRNAALERGNGWEYAVWIEGWNQKLLVSRGEGLVADIPGTPKVLIDQSARTVGILVPKEAVQASTPPESWGFAAAVLSQDGFPSAGVRRVRDVRKAGDQWKIGGGTGAANDTRIMDLVLPGPQSDVLANRNPAASGSTDGLPPERFPQVPLLKQSEADGTRRR